MSWSDERIALLKKLWLEGLSASQIAKRLGGVTRNAVIGKVTRLGLSGRATPSAPPRLTHSYRIPATPKTDLRKVSSSPASKGPKGKGPAAMITGPGHSPGPKPPTAVKPNDELAALNKRSLRVATLDLQPNQCRYATDHDGREHLFCGLRTEPGEPYCISHARVCFNGKTSMKDRQITPDVSRPTRHGYQLQRRVVA